MKFANSIAAIAAISSMMVATTAEAQLRVKARGQNGVVTAGATAGGGRVVRGRGAVDNADGSTTVYSGGVRSTGQGGTVARGGSQTYNEATGEYSAQRSAAAQSASGGTAAHQSATSATRGQGWARSGTTSATGDKGSVNASSDIARTADGTWSGGGETTITGNESGITYQAQTVIDPETGKPVHSYACTDGSGGAVACPAR